MKKSPVAACVRALAAGRAAARAQGDGEARVNGDGKVIYVALAGYWAGLFKSRYWASSVFRLFRSFRLPEA
jgi:hypothetical protein